MQLLLSEIRPSRLVLGIFFFNDTATTEIYTLSLHDALPILAEAWSNQVARKRFPPTPKIRLVAGRPGRNGFLGDRKSTRLNSSHANISYAVFCLKKTMSSLHGLTCLPESMQPVRLSMLILAS